MTTLMRLRLFAAPFPARLRLRALHTTPFGHRFSPFSPLSHNFRLSFPNRPVLLALISSRNISFGSIFSSRPSPTPSPDAVARVARVEAVANAHPYDVEKQLALFQALSETNIQPGYELIINRWERMTEFVRSLLNTFEFYSLTLDIGSRFAAPSFRQGFRVLCPGSSQGKKGSIGQPRSAQARVSPCYPPPHYTAISHTRRGTVRSPIYTNARSSAPYFAAGRFQ